MHAHMYGVALALLKMSNTAGRGGGDVSWAIHNYYYVITHSLFHVLCSHVLCALLPVLIPTTCMWSSGNQHHNLTSCDQSHGQLVQITATIQQLTLGGWTAWLVCTSTWCRYTCAANLEGWWALSNLYMWVGSLTTITSPSLSFLPPATV